MKELLSEEQIKWADEVWRKIKIKMEYVRERSSEKIPHMSFDYMHDDTKDNYINCWTNGFWPGMLWLMYAATSDARYRDIAQKLEGYLDEAFQKYDLLGHDMGFVWRLASGPDYSLTGSEKARIRQSIAANHLMARFNPNGGFIRAWNSDRDGEKTTGWVIIDTMMNLPLLFWATGEYNDPRFKLVAMKHADCTMRGHIRADGSVRHIVKYDPETGEVLGENKGQGYAEGSSWARGQAWAIYGFTLSYLYTGKEEYLDTAKRVSHYFISCVSDCWLPKMDFRAPKEEGIYDASAGVAAACGLIELAKVVPNLEKKLYINAAMNLLMSIEKQWADWSVYSDFILTMSTGNYNKSSTHNKNIIYADYYFLEAICKLKNLCPLFW